MGYEVRGFDVSPDMVALAQAKCRPEWRTRYVVADVRSLPENDDCCDAVVVSKLFMHVANWQTACRELLRVLRPGACTFQLSDGGAFGHPVRGYFAERADALGFTNRFVGLDPRDNAMLVEFFAAQGCERLPIDVTDLRWEKRISYGNALSQLEERLLVEFWYIPLHAYTRILEDTSRWVDEQPGRRDKMGLLAPYLTADVFRKPST
jgi:SAM-dependent methyltransferase